MATPEIRIYVRADMVNDEGEVPSKTLEWSRTLSGFNTVTPGARRRLASDAADVELTHDEPALVLVASHDNPFALKLADGETVIDDCMLFLAVAYQTTTAMGQLLATTEVLVSGNGTDAANLEHWHAKQA